MVLIFSIPSAIAFVTLNSSIISAIYQWSHKVSVASISLSSNILLFFSIAVVFTSMAAILNRAFYANNDTKTPLFIGAGSIILTVLLNIIFYKFTNFKAVGLSLAYSIPTVLNVLVMLFILNKKKIGVEVRLLLKYSIQILIAALLMGVVLYFTNKYSPINYKAVFTLNFKIKALSYLLVEVLIGVIVYSSIILFLKIPEGKYIFNIISEKIKLLKIRIINIFVRKR
jgi:putative peptidoglycan lipid II flippase